MAGAPPHRGKEQQHQELDLASKIGQGRSEVILRSIPPIPSAPKPLEGVK